MSMPTAVLHGRTHNGAVAKADPAARPRKRTFSSEYKLAVLAEYEAAPEGEKGSVLRREGLYSSHLGKWREQRDHGALGALEPKQRGPRPVSADTVKAARLQRELDRANTDLANARRVIEVQGKVSALLEELLSTSATPHDDARSLR